MLGNLWHAMVLYFCFSEICLRFFDCTSKRLEGQMISCTVSIALIRTHHGPVMQRVCLFSNHLQLHATDRIEQSGTHFCLEYP